MTDLVLLFGRDFGKSSFEAVWLEDRVPAEHIFTSGFDDFAFALTDEDLRLLTWSFAESVDTLRVCCVVVEGFDHLPETFTSDLPKEVLTIELKIDVKNAQRYGSIKSNQKLTCRAQADHCMR